MILVIDNYDSFVYNLVHYLEDLGAETEVHRNDALSVDAILKKKPAGVLISPGPGRPEDAGVCIEFLRRAPNAMPVLGVCLGHQAMGAAFGGDVIQAGAIMHGKTSAVRHHGRGLFRGLPSPLTATRYHSLAVQRETLPDGFEIDAETEDGEIMAMHHRERPLFGLQFHPESIASEYGHALIGAFLDTAGAR
jgi:anthranilate synthase component 2